MYIRIVCWKNNPYGLYSKPACNSTHTYPHFRLKYASNSLIQGTSLRIGKDNTVSINQCINEFFINTHICTNPALIAE